MADASDKELLQDYERTGSEPAFAELVRRHVNLVYSAALRHVGGAAQAEEITQAVFIILASKAGSLRSHAILEGWLYQTTRLTSLRFLRGERRRQFREQEAYMQSRLQQGAEDSAWTQLSPLLDEALSQLGEKDRDAVVLRYFKNKSVKEIAAALQMNDAAAQRRVLRATEKLRKFFARRGVHSATSIIGEEICAHSIQPAPAALATSVATLAAAKGAAASGSTLILVKGALKMMAWAKAKTAVALTATAIVAAGTAFFAYRASFASIDGTFRSVLFKNEYQQYANRFVGTWQGTMGILMNSQGWVQKHRFVVKVLESDGVYRAVVDGLDDAMKNVLVPKVTLDKLSINFAADSLSYHGVFHKDATEIRGLLRYRLGSYLLVLTRTNAPDAVAAPLAKEDYAPRAGSDLQGVWKTVVTNQTRPQTLYLKIAEATDGKLRGECLSSDMGLIVPMPVTGWSFETQHVHFAVVPITSSFAGVLSADHSTMRGQWKWSMPGRGSRITHVNWTRVKPDEEELTQPPSGNFDYASDAELQGHWSATFPPQFGVALKLTLNIVKLPDGEFSSTLDSPDQLLFEMPAKVLQFKPSKVKIEAKAAHATFEGRLVDGKLTGDWTFYDVSAPVVFERSKP